MKQKREHTLPIAKGDPGGQDDNPLQVASPNDALRNVSFGWPLYRYRSLFHLLLRIEYGRFFVARYEALARLIPRGSSVVEVCCGDCLLFLKYLKTKDVDYVGLDNSPALVAWARKRGVRARVFNVLEDSIPKADYVVLHASLYQFDPRSEEVARKLICAAREKAIIAETVRNLSHSRVSPVSALANYFTRPIGVGANYTGRRFDSATLVGFFDRLGGLENHFLIAGGREMVGVFTGRAAE